MGVSEIPFCDGCLKTSKVCWKGTQIIEGMGHIRQKCLGLSAETVYIPFRCSIEAGFEFLQR